MKTLVRLDIAGKPATVSFLSRYHDQNDFEVSCDGRTGRIRETDDGTIRTHSIHFSDEHAALAIAAWRAHDAAQFARWCEEHPGYDV